jgi:hypothetical protein
VLLCGDILRHFRPPFPGKKVVDLVDRVITAIARELVGFIWAIARQVEPLTTAA